MPIFRAIGFGILLIILSLMLPDVLKEGRDAAIAFLRGARISADTAAGIAASAAATQGTQPLPPLLYPQTPSIPSY